jgi:DNA replication protein DnaC
MTIDRPWMDRREDLEEKDFDLMRIPEEYKDKDMSHIPGDEEGYFENKSGKSEYNPLKSALISFEENLKHMFEEGLGFYMWGPNGTGKTTAGCWILKEYHRRGKTSLFLKSEKLRETSFEDIPFNSTTTLRERAKNVGVLLIDDIGKEYRGSKYNANKLYDLMRERISNKRSTFLTGNIQPEEIDEIYNKSLKETMRASIMPILAKGPNLREKKQRENWEFLKR